MEDVPPDSIAVVDLLRNFLRVLHLHLPSLVINPIRDVLQGPVPDERVHLGFVFGEVHERGEYVYSKMVSEIFVQAAVHLAELHSIAELLCYFIPEIKHLFFAVLVEHYKPIFPLSHQLTAIHPDQSFLFKVVFIQSSNLITST